jgi:malate dehydrogenase
MCRQSEGEYGVDKGLIFSVPCRLERGELKVVENLTLNDYGHEMFNITLNELRQERDTVKSLGLLD